jgi:methyl-CpG-binding domain protein 4
MADKELERLVQEDLRHDPWRLLVACVLLNRSRGSQVRPVLDELFERWPTCNKMKNAPYGLVAKVIERVGLQNTKAESIVRMSSEYSKMKRKYGFIPATLVRHLTGVGEYGEDSWFIFVLDLIEIEPNDEKLKAYVKRARKELDASGRVSGS